MKSKKVFCRMISAMYLICVLFSVMTPAVFASSEFAITSEPQDVVAEVGDSVSMSVETSEPASYQWQYSADGGTTWTNLAWASAKEATLTTPALIKARLSWVFRCKVKSNDNEVLYTRTVSLLDPNPYAIVSEPQDVAAGVGDSVTMTVEVSKQASYQWQYSADGGTTWTNLAWASAKEATLTTPALIKARLTWVFRCKTTSADNEVLYTRTVSLLNPNPFAIVSEPQDVAAGVGDSVTMTVEVSKQASYQWQYSADGGTTWTNLAWASAKEATLTTPALIKARLTWVFRCKVTSTDNEVLYTRTVSLIALGNTIIFDAGSGAFASGSSTYQTTAPSGTFYLNDIEEPVWEGHGFLCWKLNGKRVTRVSLTADVTLTAEWVDLYKITFNANGGQYDNGDEVFFEYYAPGTINVEDVTPCREGYDFDGWMLNGSRVKKLRLTGDVELVAQWSPVIEVTYDANGGYWQFDDEPSFTTTVTREEPGLFYIGWHEPIRDDGYVFVGWTVDGEDLEYIELTGPITVKAQWAKQYCITYDPNGGSWDGQTEPRTDNPFEGEYEVNFWWPENEGFEFVGWSTNPNATEAEARFTINVSANVTYYAIWEPSGEIAITYDANGGMWEDGKTFDYHHQNVGEYYTVGTYEPRRAGYEFDGWQDAQNNRVDGNEYILEANTEYVFRAIWVEAFVVTYDATDGEFDGFDANNNETVKIHYRTARAGEYYYDGWEPCRENYRFAGWSLDGENRVDNPMTISQNTTLYALWDKIVNVTYVTDVGYWVDEWDPEGEPLVTITSYTDYDIGDDYRISGWWPEVSEEYDLLGYTTEEGSKVVEYSIDQQVGRFSDDITLYLVWQKRPIITYDAGEGRWGDEEFFETIRTDIQDVGRKYYVGFDQPWRDGYEFIGWVDEDGNPADRRFLDLKEGDEYTFYATWEKIVVITYDANGGSWGDRTIDEHYCRIGEYYYVGCWEPHRDGYLFDGWTDEDGNPVDDMLLMIAENDNYTFYASWVEAVKVTYLANGGEWDDYDSENGETALTHYRMERLGEFYPDGWHPDRPGYWFMGWSLDGENPIEIPMTLEGEITLKALWRKQITITYETQISGWKRNENGQDIFVTSFDRENNDHDETRVDGWWPENLDSYRFLGYTTIEGSDEVEYQPNDPLETGEEDITLYAVWEHIPTIRYHANGGFWGGFDDGEDIRIHYQRAGQHYYVRCEWPWINGGEFAGWVDSEGNPADDRMIELQADDEFDFYATWKSDIQIIYDANGGYWPDDDGQVLSVSTIASSGDYHVGWWFPERPGYSCLGWSVDQKATTGVDQWDTVLTESVTYYAIWERTPILTLDAGEDGIFNETNEQTMWIGYRVGQVIGTDFGQLPEPQKEGYRFIGWTLNGEFVGRRYRMTDDVTFVAAWIKVCEVCFDANGGAFGDGEGLLFEICDEGSFYALQFAEEPVREGYVFDGWILETGDYVNQFVVDENVKFIATWVEDVA